MISRPEDEWIEVPGVTPALISRDAFLRAKTILDDPARRRRGKPSVNYRMRGHLRCLACGTPMVGQVHSGGRCRYYRCRRSYTGYFEGSCDAKYIPVDVLERAVLKEVAKVLSHPQRIMEEARRYEDGRQDIRREEQLAVELKEIEQRQARLAKLYMTGSIPDTILESQGKELTQQRSNVEEQLTRVLSFKPAGMDLVSLEKNLPGVARRVSRWVTTAAADDMRLILRALDIQVRASRDKVEIEGVLPVPESAGDQDLVTIVQTSA